MTVTQFVTSDYSYTALAGATAAALNALADDGVVLSSAIDNSTAKHKYMKLAVNLAAVDLSAEASPGIQVRLIEALDNTPTLWANNSPQSYAITIPLEIGTTSQAHLEVGDLIVPHHFKLAIVNKTGAALTSTDANVITYTLYTDETDI